MTTLNGTVHIKSLTLPELRADASGTAIAQLGELIIQSFGEAPWHEHFFAPRIHFGLGIEMMRLNALLYVAGEKITDTIVGYILGQELVKESDDVRALSLSGLSGTTAMDYLFDDGQRIFYVGGLAVRRDFRRRGIAECLSRALIEDLRRQGFGYRLGRTDRSSAEMRRLYAKLGFTELSIHDAHHPNRTYWLLAL